MKILFDIGHPAHVHLFRNTIHTLQSRGHEVTVSIRNRPIIRKLLRHYGLEAIPASTPRSTLLGLAWELLEHDYNVLRLAKRHRFDVLAGTSVAAAHVSRIVSARSVVFSEDDADVVRLFAGITYPFSDKVVVPAVIGDKTRRNYVRHNSYHELAYLHPNHYRPDPAVTEELGVRRNEPYFIVRLVAFRAHHDAGHTGIGTDLQHKLVELLAARGRVFITVEGEVPEPFASLQMPIPAHRMHDALAFARLLVSDSQTMTAEAAVLGVPAVRCNSFVGRLAYLRELEDYYGLAYGFVPSESDRMLETVRRLLEMGSDIGPEWHRRRQRMLSDKVDFHEWMVGFFETV